MGELDGKAALITGGARGFGRSIARLLAREGADIAVVDLGGGGSSLERNYFSTSDDLARTAREVEALGRKAIAIEADVRSEQSCQRAADETLGAFGKIDILVANAGVATFAPNAWEITEDDWDFVLDVCLKGVFLTTKAVVPHMVERRAGKIVITASRNGLKVERGFAHYNAAKAGAIHYMRSLALELGPYEINVNAICPTSMTDKSASPRRSGNPYWDQVVGKPEATYAEFDIASGEENLFSSGGQPDFSEVAESVLWLVSDRARLVTGHALPVDAGYIVKRGG